MNGSYAAEVLMTSNGPYMLAMRPFVRGVPSDEAITITLMAGHSGATAIGGNSFGLSFFCKGHGLSRAVAGEPACYVSLVPCSL